MKVEGEEPEPDTVAAPWEAAEETLQTSEKLDVSLSVADKVGATHPFGAPSSDMMEVSGPAPCVMTGGVTACVTVTMKRERRPNAKGLRTRQGQIRRAAA